MGQSRLTHTIKNESFLYFVDIMYTDPLFFYVFRIKFIWMTMERTILSNTVNSKVRLFNEIIFHCFISMSNKTNVLFLYII